MEQLWELYAKDPKSIDSSWRHYFDTLSEPASKEEKKTLFSSISSIVHLIDLWRRKGHLEAQFNPLFTREKHLEELSLEVCGLFEKDLSNIVPTMGVLPEKQATLQKLLEALRKVYAGRIGCEFMHSDNAELKIFVASVLESTQGNYSVSSERKRKILEELNRTELFESFMHTHFVGQKRFSVEGTETLIPAMKAVIDEASNQKAKEIVIGMAHRGRLSVLSNILDKSYRAIFSEFEERYIPDSFEGSGDVKYHKGFTSDVTLSNGKTLKLYLCPNPSHLEAVDAVVQGEARARQMRLGKEENFDQVLPILVHGDAALSGQGVIYETMQMYGLKGYGNGGTLHFVINNQVGFTADPEEGRSTLYCTDIAKAFGAPVFHVSSEDPEACVFASLLSLEIRQRFHVDVFIDLYGYRKYGHNESDEPSFTQPILYKQIKDRPCVRTLYAESLRNTGALEERFVVEMEATFKEELKMAHQKEEKSLDMEENVFLQKRVESFNRGRELMMHPVDTRFSRGFLEKIEFALTIPEGFTSHQKLVALLKQRQEALQGKRPVDWATGELVAFGTLLQEGISIRFAGQDSCRGTFSQRHATLKDQRNGDVFTPLTSLAGGSTFFTIVNSPLSEYAALGFEYGYSIADFKCLVIWEAQFGDFSNGGQVVIDQFIATAEQKWDQQSKLVLMLPHGYEGQGPEHSSARIERFLTLCAENNMYVAYPTTPKQLCHLLRRQAHSKVRKPLVVFTPKGLLRLPECTSSADELCEGRFEEIIDDPNTFDLIEQLIFCSGRIYYDLVKERELVGAKKMAIVRIEQLYPLQYEKLASLMKKYSEAKTLFWVQDEPENMGMWEYMRPRLESLKLEGMDLQFIGRRRSASPATGSLALHKQQQRNMMEILFSGARPSIFDVASQSYKQGDKKGKVT